MTDTPLVHAGDPPPPAGEYQVTVLPDGIRIRVRSDESIVDALRRQGYRSRYKCRRGGCGACRATLVDGDVDYHTPVSASVVNGPDRKPGEQKCLPCRAVPQSDVTIELGERDRLVYVLAGFGRSRQRTT
ncbi:MULTISPECIES: 2Fe-2S iron-sulfur cluster-binding protein [unclassified Rhodococcus (in: high G+C Gram-positive bacteria)]|uniref:2Fe-2S iron-sulfur cluster-binding protein n=1 Tax=unclassified Rhodococcus (in: high G+C Gram-positive bacteria) TaxID=192944 RepID=UPI001639D911|nr:MULTISPECIES: 2Fe-2S iron-sulfur cluster-binding protein [unclassified Rhodococcus (in: high G+C Gram-positive bacteria)]MBC2637878.1 2Fe-2S iron-sulfur cluster binding domain-containing protein [Rhodococcus sp. 3A]MBC2897374.1 2Fe-2S iron-sulfur cluster binding domain-containing protein [Rhodococcus sp. 4CII]